jgi:hypothetical protein
VDHGAEDDDVVSSVGQPGHGAVGPGRDAGQAGGARLGGPGEASARASVMTVGSSRRRCLCSRVPMAVCSGPSTGRPACSAAAAQTRTDPQAVLISFW